MHFSPVLQSSENPPFSEPDALDWVGLESVVFLLRAVFVMSGNLVIYSTFLSRVISHRYGSETWQPSDKGAMFNHHTSQYFKFNIVFLWYKLPPFSLHIHTLQSHKATIFLPLSSSVYAVLSVSLPTGSESTSGVCNPVRKEEVMLTQSSACHASKT